MAKLGEANNNGTPFEWLIIDRKLGEADGFEVIKQIYTETVRYMERQGN